MKCSGYKILTDSFNFVGFQERRKFFRVEVISQDGSFGVYSNNLDVRVLLLEVFSCAADRTSGSNGNDEVIDLASCLLPDFWSSRIVMCFHVLGVVVLICKERIWCLSDNPLGNFVVAFWRIVRYDRGCHNHLCTKCLQESNLLLAHLIWHRKDSSISFVRRGDRQAETSISRCSLHNCTSRFQSSFSFCLLNQLEGNPIFHRPSRVEELHFCQDQGLVAFCDPVDSH